MRHLPVVAIVGRPNVGKSALLNRIVGRRHAIVEETPGVTRDRNYAPADWNGKTFHVVDTGGLDPDNKTTMQESINTQVEFALQEAEAIIFLCDFSSGLMPHDRQIFDLLRRKCTGKPLLVAVNKVDNPKCDDQIYEFWELGVEKLFPISAIHGHGVADMLDELLPHFPDRTSADLEPEPENMIALVGKPNVGKSSLLNRLLGAQRSIVDDAPGTTRDTIHVTINQNGKAYHFIDTAGLRRPARRKEAIEIFSVIRTLQTIKRSDIAVLLLDATEGEISEQDKRIAGKVIEGDSACIIAWNKWDIADRGQENWDKLYRMTRTEFPQLEFAPIFSMSAKSGQRVDRLFELIDQVQEAGAHRIPQARLRDILFEALTIQPPPSHFGRPLVIEDLHQCPGPGITFRVRCSEPLGLHFSYQRYLLNQIKQEYQFFGWPLKMHVTKRSTKKH